MTKLRHIDIPIRKILIWSFLFQTVGRYYVVIEWEIHFNYSGANPGRRLDCNTMFHLHPRQDGTPIKGQAQFHIESECFVFSVSIKIK